MLTKVFTAEHISEAGLIRSYLEQHNVPSQLRNEYVSGALGDLPFMTSSPEIWVDSSIVSTAAKLIAELNQPNIERPEWSCSECSEANPGNFSSCWNCQSGVSE